MKLKGIITALVTPFDAQGDVDFEAFDRLLEHQLAAGVHGFVPCGSTGEYYGLSWDERIAVFKFVMEKTGDRAQLIAGTGAGSTGDVIAYSQAARELGYQAILAAPPYYAMPAQEELITHFQAILDAVDVEIVLYNYPYKTGVEIGHEVLAHFADEPRVIAIKDSAGVVQRATELTTRYPGKYQLSNGSDDLAFDFFMWGADSWICGPANAFAKECVAFYDAFTAGDIMGAREIMRALYPGMASLEGGKFIQKVKYGAELAGCPVGLARPPLQALNEAEKADFAAAFRLATGGNVAAAAE